MSSKQFTKNNHTLLQFVMIYLKNFVKIFFETFYSLIRTSKVKNFLKFKMEQEINLVHVKLVPITSTTVITYL